jgi:hypothetical protein
VALRSRIGQFTKPFYSKSATMKIRLLIPDVNAHPTDRPRACVYCAKAILQRHGTVPKPIKDHEMGRVETHRYKCTCCHRIFRHYPQGVTAKDQSQRTVVLAALMYGLRLSCSAASHLLWALGVEVSKMSVWRDAQEAGEALRRKRPVGKVWVLGADETVYKVSGQEVVVGFLTDAGGERTLGFEVLTEGDGHAVVEWLEPYARELGAEVLVSDDNDSYGLASAELGLSHQLCLAHVRKYVTRRSKSILEQAQEEWSEEGEEKFEKLEEDLEWLRRLLEELPEEGGKQIGRLHRKYLWAEPPTRNRQKSEKKQRRRKPLPVTGCGCSPWSYPRSGTRYAYTFHAPNWVSTAPTTPPSEP